MEIQQRNVIVLTADGEFVTCKKQQRTYAVGEEIQVANSERQSKLVLLPWRKYISILLIFCFCIGIFVYNKPEATVYAYVSIDINPSIEASVTENLQVIELHAYNEDGKLILSGLKEWKGRSIQEVVAAIVQQSEIRGYLMEDKRVMLTSVKKDKDIDEEQQMQHVMNELKQQYKEKSVTVIYQESTMSVREDAAREGISTGVYINKKNEKQQNQREKEKEKHEPLPTIPKQPFHPTVEETSPEEKMEHTIPKHAPPAVEKGNDRTSKESEQKENSAGKPSTRNKQHPNEKKDNDKDKHSGDDD
jgi:hypothetical protein